MLVIMAVVEYAGSYTVAVFHWLLTFLTATVSATNMTVLVFV